MSEPDDAARGLSEMFDNIDSEDVGLVIPVPAPDTVLLVIREGDKYAYMPVAREFLEDTEQCWPTLSKVLTHMDRYIEQMEQHGKARNANGDATPGS